MKIAVIENQNYFHDIINEIKKHSKFEELEVFYYCDLHKMEESFISFELIFLKDTQNHIIYSKENIDKNFIFITHQYNELNDILGSNIYGFIRNADSHTRHKEIIEHIFNRVFRDKVVVFKIDHSFQQFILSDIVYFQYIGGRTIGFVCNQKQYLIKNITLKTLKEKLDNQFIYIDRSTLVNVYKIENMVRNDINLSGIKQSFKISKRRVTALRKKYKEVN